MKSPIFHSFINLSFVGLKCRSLFYIQKEKFWIIIDDFFYSLCPLYSIQIHCLFFISIISRASSVFNPFSHFYPRLDGALETLHTHVTSVLYFCFSILKYSPNPGGGQSSEVKGSQRSSCNLCVDPRSPISDQICPFHKRKTQGLVVYFDIFDHRLRMLSSLHFWFVYVCFSLFSLCFVFHFSFEFFDDSLFCQL